MINKKNCLLFIWFITLILLVVCTFIFTKVTKLDDELYNKMYEASNLANVAYGKIKEYKINQGIEISEDDILKSGMIGSSKRTAITTTEGVLEAKRTTCNPEWAGMIVRIMYENGIKENDKVGAIFSGSFPALNICVMAAFQVYNVDSIIFASIGASYYGANQEECTFFDMCEYLKECNVFNKTVDYFSLGGADDIGNDFHNVNVRTNIINKIKASNVNYIEIENYKENIDYRLNILKDNINEMKLFINCGGTLVAYGEGLDAFSKTGFIKGSNVIASFNQIINNRNSKMGLLECIHRLGIDILSMKDIKTLSIKYGLPYDPVKIEIGSSDVFYKKKYNIVFPIIGVVFSIGCLIYWFIYRKNLFNKKIKL